MTDSTLQSLNHFKDAYERRIDQLTARRKEGKRTVGTFCLFVPDEIIYAAGADRVILCGGRNATVSLAEEYLPRTICPLIKSSLGSVVSRECCGVAEACPHFDLVDMVVAETTCDGKKKMYELLDHYIPTYVIDLPQKPESPEALRYYRGELKKFKVAMERLTDSTITDEELRKEIRSANETRRLLYRLYDLRKRDPPPVMGVDILKVLQKQYFLSPEDFRTLLRELCDEAEQITGNSRHMPRIMISGCPMAGGNTKVADIIEERGGVIVAEESCTGTRSFWDLIDEDEDKNPLTAIAERYLKIPCSCMTPNERRADRVRELVKSFKVDGVVYYTLQSCHGYNIEKFTVQQALRERHIPMLAIETDYSDSDVGQIEVRVDAFMEMVSSSP
jgi:benzoyl-CoA reductase/2-hydroxyglutaryl-CoA dehydratase subunit BcrC/BadD/HgdB